MMLFGTGYVLWVELPVQRSAARAVAHAGKKTKYFHFISFSKLMERCIY